MCLTPSVPPLIPAHPSLCKPARSPHLDCSLCSAVDPRVLRASGRAMAQNDRVNEKATIATELVSTGGFVSERRAIELPACTPLGTRVRVHLTNRPGIGISPLASAMRWGSTPHRVGRRSNHRDLSRTLAMASIALAFSSPFLPSDALICSCRLRILIRAHSRLVKRSRAVGTSSF